MSSTAVAKREPESRNVLRIIGDLARDPAVSVEKMQALLEMQRVISADEAKKSFIRAKIKMRAALPVVQRNGMIEVHDKQDKSRVIQSTPFAKFEDIHEMVMPVLQDHGFDLDFRTGTTGAPEWRPLVTCILSHKDGHQETCDMVGPLDTSGSKNNIQGVGSTTSYLKRYTMSAILNIRTSDKGEFDDDGIAGGRGAELEITTITAEQVAEVRDLMREYGADEQKFCAYAGYAIEDMPASEFEMRTKQIRMKRKSEGNHG